MMDSGTNKGQDQEVEKNVTLIQSPQMKKYCKIQEV